MGQVSFLKFTILVCFLGLTGFWINTHDRDEISKTRPATLKQFLVQIPGWQLVNIRELDKEIVHSLKLDDYIDADYVNGPQRVSLYIGYYFSGGKVGAAHDPMVCFPGQGWTLSGITSGSIVLPTPAREKLRYSIMTASKQDKRQLVIYWFQAHDKNSPNTFGQKLLTLYNKLTLGRGDNAFVRIIVDIKDGSTEQEELTAQRFIKAFYPVFLGYISEI